MPPIGAEAGGASAVAFLGSTIVAAYLADRLGFSIAPFAICAIGVGVSGTTWMSLRRRTTPDRPALAAVAGVALGALAWLMWRARPDFLPTGRGSDLTHHLALLAYIEQHGRLPHDPVLAAYLGEMVDYTPGAHLLAVLAGRWTHSDGLHVVHGVVALTIGLKLALLLLIARRLMPAGIPRLPFAIVAALLPWLPYVFFAGSFMEQSFLSQVIAELFAVAMWWTIVDWSASPSAGAMVLYALFGSAVFLTWPVWIGPLVLTLVAVALTTSDVEWPRRLRHLAIALLPIAIVAALYAAGRQVYGFRMVNAVGFAIWPTPRSLGWPFIILGVSGVAWAAFDRRARSAATLFAAILLQGTALIATGLNSGATAPYLSLKMTYLAIYPLSVAAAVLVAQVWCGWFGAAARYAWMPAVVVSIAVLRSLAAAPALTPVVTQPVFLAGEWARTRLQLSCVDYLVEQSDTAYWLHLAIFGNPRAAGRALDEDTFNPRKAIVRWILPGGLQYAIAGNFDALPRDIRSNVDILARFGAAAVVERRGPSTCADQKGMPLRSVARLLQRETGDRAGERVGADR